jgi:CubicO group peptidase (beta-lactamase class C family)
LAQEIKGLNEFINKLMDEWKVPGLSIAIVKDEEVILSQGFGPKSRKDDLEVTPETLFAIGSCTKAFTAVSMGILVDEGRVEWDKPVREYLPDFKMHDPYVTENMTPRDLLTHRSGLPRHDLLWYGSSLTRKELCDRLQYLEPSKGFRAFYQYQNLMYMTAGYLVGQVAGSTWEEFVQKRILDPLDMANTNFSVTKSQESSDFALPYAEVKDGVDEIPFKNIDAMGPAGSINSSVTDMAKWLLLNLDKGKHGEEQIISEGSLDQIYAPQIVMQEPIKHEELLYPTYGMGWAILTYRGHHILSHGGGIDGFSAQVSLIPREGVGMVILTNMGGTPIPSIIAFNLYDRFLGLDEIPWNQRIRDEVTENKKNAEEAKKKAEADRKTGTQPSHPLKDYTGTFQHPAYGAISIEVEDDHLKMTYNSTPLPLEHYHYDTFQGKSSLFSGGMKFTFPNDVHGNISSISAPLESAVKDIVFTRIQAD